MCFLDITKHHSITHKFEPSGMTAALLHGRNSRNAPAAQHVRVGQHPIVLHGGNPRQRATALCEQGSIPAQTHAPAKTTRLKVITKRSRLMIK